MNIIFDFDGVIINSHKIKTNAFHEIFKDYGNNVAKKSKKYHQKNISKSRYLKFKFIIKNILKKKVNKKEILSLDRKFDLFVERKIKKMQITKYLLDFLKQNNKVYNLYISTGTPQNKIIKILKEKKIFNFFKKIYGSPASKITHINRIKKKNNKILFIGDSLEDYKVAKKANINFFLKLNSENLSFRNKIKVKKINSFKKLNKHIKILKT